MNVAFPRVEAEEQECNESIKKEKSLSAYYNMPIEEIHKRGFRIKEALGDDLLVLCHHYQQDETFIFGDVSGDSLYLAQQAAATPAKYIVFCGVHFMAESADIITSEDQIVMLPDLSAGCSMADMAELGTVEAAWEKLIAICCEEDIIPITYINSAATLKAFCGQHGGTVCTSSNSDKILKWALDQNKRVLFFPDQHLGRNTANTLGVPKEKIVLWRRNLDDGGLSKESIEDSQVILWDGYCSVHCRFTPEQVKKARAENPDVKIIVHPECPEEIVNASDYSGSTNKIMDVIQEAPEGSQWYVGTEISMVNRMARDLKKEKNIDVKCLDSKACPCSTMFQIYPGDVLRVLENLAEGNIVNRITVPEETKHHAGLALERMLSLSRAG